MRDYEHDHDMIREEQEANAPNKLTEIILATKVIGDCCLVWEAIIDEASDEVNDETFRVGVRCTEADQPTRMVWKEWREHHSLEDAIEEALFMKSPDFHISEQWIIQAYILKIASANMRGESENKEVA